MDHGSTSVRHHNLLYLVVVVALERSESNSWHSQAVIQLQVLRHFTISRLLSASAATAAEDAVTARVDARLPRD